MPELTAFLLARIADDEAAARAAVWVSDDPEWNGVDTWDDFTSCGEMQVGPLKGAATDTAVVSGPFRGGLHMTGKPTEGRNGAVAAHIARHDPARVLAECEAKRAIVELHSAYPTPQHMVYGTITACSECGSVDDAPVEWPCPTLRALAAVYSDHEAYDESWRP